jgi:hypothetical protein
LLLVHIKHAAQHTLQNRGRDLIISWNTQTHQSSNVESCKYDVFHGNNLASSLLDESKAYLVDITLSNSRLQQVSAKESAVVFM